MFETQAFNLKVESSSALVAQYRIRLAKTRPAAGDVSRAATSELPAFLQRPDHFFDRNLDAVRGSVLAGIPDYWFVALAGAGGLRVADTSISARADRRRRGGPLQPPSHCHRNTDIIDAARLRSFRSHLAWAHSGVADHDPGRASGRGECF